MNLIFRGFWSSIMATSSMTMSLLQMHKYLPGRDQKPLPPAQLTESMKQKSGLGGALSSELQQEATMFSHYGYGAACGTLYAAVAPHLPGSALKKGVAFGASVWAASYYGLIPGINAHPTGHRMSLQRNSMMFLAHLVWGTSLSFAEEQLRRKGPETLDGRRQYPAN
jgi:uncharacterized membrane protein YagU involved in acid resistance